MSGLEVIGGISAVIAIIEASVKIWDNAQKDIKLPETFKIVARRLPLLLSTLQICHDRLEPIRDTLPPDTVESFRGVVQNSKAQARLMRDIFEETVPGEDAKRLDRYRAAVKSVGKGKRVEQLLQSISEDTRVLADYHNVRTAQPDLVPRLEEMIKELQDAAPSVEEEASSSSPFQNFNYGGGQQNISTGHARHSGQGDQHVYGGVGAINQYSGPVHHHRVQPRLNVSSKKCGLCLGGAPLIDVDLIKGRSIELEEMQTQLQVLDTGCDRRCVVLGGLGGVGKTQLAIAFARQHRSAYHSVFWLNAASEATLKISFRQAAEVIFDQQSLTEFEDEAVLEGVRQWLSRHDNTPWLLIFDNYDEPDVYNVEKYYPTATHGSIIVTTRLPSQVNGSQIRVQPLHKIEDGLAVLQARSRRTNAAADPHARQLAQRLGGLPLALVTAGAYLHTSTLSFQQYLSLYEQRWQVDTQRPQRLPDYDHTLYTTWNLSYAQLEKDRPEAARMLQLLAYFNRQEIWHGLCHAGWSERLPEWLQLPTADQASFDSVMRTLAEYCLVEVQYISQSYSLHGCVHDWTLGELNREIDPQLYWYAFDCVAASLDRNDWDVLNRTKYSRVSQHGVRLTHHRFAVCNESEDDLAERLDEAGWIARMLREQVQLSAAEQMYVRALTGYEKALGPDHSSTLDTVNNLGLLYADQGKLDKAEQMYVRALTGYEKALGPDHSSTLGTVNNLGNLCRDQGKLDEAEQMYLRALTGYEKALGPDDTDTLSTVNNLGNLYCDRGKLDEAEQMYLRALAGKEKALGPDHSSTLDTVNNLGLLYADQGKLDKAEQMYERALAGREKALGPDHTSTLGTVNNLGLLYAKQGKLDEAEQMYTRALAGKEKALGPDHTSTLDTVNNLGILYRDQGELDKAEQTYLRALAGKEKALGPDHSSTLDTVNNLGDLYANQDRLNEAEQLLQGLLARREKVLGSRHIAILNTVHNLGNVYYRQSKYDKAEQMYTRALAGKEKALRPDHTSTLQIINNLGNLYASQGKPDEAEQMYVRALAAYEKALGPDHSLTLDTVNNLGILYKDQGKLDEAEQMYVRALAGYEKALGPDHTSTMMLVHNFGRLYERQGRREEAESMYRRALTGYVNRLGQEHPRTRTVAGDLAELGRQQGSIGMKLSSFTANNKRRRRESELKDIVLRNKVRRTG